MVCVELTQTKPLGLCVHDNEGAGVNEYKMESWLCTQCLVVCCVFSALFQGVLRPMCFLLDHPNLSMNLVSLNVFE